MAYNVKFLQGTLEQFNGLLNKDSNTFYYVGGTDLYLGDIKLSNASDLAAAIARIETNEGNISTNAADIEQLKKDLGALTGGEGNGTISEMIEDAIDALRTELNAKIEANTTAIGTEKTRAEGVEAGLANRIKAVEDDYLVEADKTELSNAIGAEKTRAEAAEKVNADAIAAVKEDVDYFFKDAGFDDPETAKVYKDTLKEIQDYIDSDATAAGEMAASIKANADAIDAIEADYLKAADKTELQGNIDGVVGRVATLEGKVDVAKVSEAIATAKGEAATDAQGKADAALASAKAYADGLAGNYATAAQGAKADTALQAADVTTGGANGTIAVKGADVAVKGLKSAAYADAADFDAAGSANTALTNAKAYVDTALTWGTIA